MEMDRPHTQKKKQINCKAGPNMEPTRARERREDLEPPGEEPQSRR